MVYVQYCFKRLYVGDSYRFALALCRVRKLRKSLKVNRHFFLSSTGKSFQQFAGPQQMTLNPTLSCVPEQQQQQHHLEPLDLKKERLGTATVFTQKSVR